MAGQGIQYDRSWCVCPPMAVGPLLLMGDGHNQYRAAATDAWDGCSARSGPQILNFRSGVPCRRERARHGGSKAS